MLTVYAGLEEHLLMRLKQIDVFKYSKENNMKVQYANEFVEQLGIVDRKTCVYQLTCD